jgi:hypothetical protein
MKATKLTTPRLALGVVLSSPKDDDHEAGYFVVLVLLVLIAF